MTIPSRIIQTGKSSELHGLARASAAGLKRLNPGWEYAFFDDAGVQRFIDKEFPQYRQIFDGFRYRIQRFDFFRYLAVYRLGGFYFDLDILLWAGLEPLLSSACVFPFEELTLNRYLRSQYGMDWEIGNYAFGAAAGHPFLEAVIDNCVRAQKDPDWVKPMMAQVPWVFRDDFQVLNTTGPGLLTRTLAEDPDAARSINVLFPEDVCDTRNWHHFGEYGVHLMSGSWRDRGGFIRRRLGNIWETRTKQKLMPESVVLGKSRSAVPRSAHVPDISQTIKSPI